MCVLVLIQLLFDLHAAPLTLGTINKAPAKEIRQFTPVAAHIADMLEFPGIQGGRVIVAANIAQMADLLKTGQVDLYFDSPLIALGINHLSGAEMVLRRWKHDHQEYSSVIYVRNESTIQQLSDLEGETIGFKDEHSSSGYLLPSIALAEAGLTLVPAAKLRTGKKPGQTGYLFTNANENTVVWVLFGKIAAGAGSREEFLTKARSEQERLRVIHESQPIPRHVVSFRPGMPEALRSALMDVLVTMHQSVKGREMLQRFENTARFDPLPEETVAQLEQMRSAVLAILGIP
ncbi:MAG: phosphate/phosphite/phosphonate ABC transporter substrate-binding protein [Magnetococcales bacterium]|nr:phosphate/phosphite/phosphonate ABC transporter substrate-binding protein [Magnetococcales bacterium]